MSSSDLITSFARSLAEVKTQLDTLRRAQANGLSAGLASVENANIQVKGPDGELRAVIGRHGDDTFAVSYVNGPAPPTPSAPNVVAHQLGLVVGWDGTFPGAAVPADLARVDVHVSTVSGFTADATTVYGSLYAEGAIPLPADSTAHYVRLVAVSTSDVASAPSAQVAGTPLRASQIDVGAVTADTLEVDLELATRIVCGAIAGAHVEMNPSGIVSTDSTGRVTFYLLASDGTVMVSGEFRTADSGQRIVMNPAGSSDPALRFYPNSGTNYAEIRSTTVTSGGVDYGAIAITGDTTITGTVTVAGAGVLNATTLNTTTLNAGTASLTASKLALPGGDVNTDANGQMHSLDYYGGTFHGALVASERRLKVHDSTIDNGLDVIRELVPARWRWREPDDRWRGHDHDLHAGVYLDEFEAVAPEAARDQMRSAGPGEGPEPSGEKTYEDRALIAYLVSAVQQLAQRNDELSARVWALGG